MKYGFVYPGGDARDAAECAYEAEAAGWDGFFVWEPVWGIDAWVSLTAAAMRTERIRLGTLLTPVSRMRPWKLASETATLDRLSNGRVILSVGLGATDTGFVPFGEETDRKTRAELLDEGLDILTGLWRGQPFRHEGKHYHVEECAFHPPPPPVQTPRIPIWVVGAWPRAKSMRRVLRYDGLLPNKLNARGAHVKFNAADIRAMKAYVDEHRAETTPFDIIVEGTTPGRSPRQAAAKVKPWANAGVTWWIEALWSLVDKMWTASAQKRILTRIKQGPPRIE
jgi:alkanesulfonate monooxygenase SsuD/methylene tetrahydromethanopterin reductase-like flavin-dependent oxidoreductase (luciferase family)